MPGRESLRATDVDVRRAKRHQHNSGSLYSRRHRRDHPAQISARQSYAAFFAPIDSAYIDVAPKKKRHFAASEEPLHAIAFQGRQGPKPTIIRQTGGEVEENHVSHQTLFNWKNR